MQMTMSSKCLQNLKSTVHHVVLWSLDRHVNKHGDAFSYTEPVYAVRFSVSTRVSTMVDCSLLHAVSTFSSFSSSDSSDSGRCTNAMVFSGRLLIAVLYTVQYASYSILPIKLYSVLNVHKPGE